MSLDPAPQSQSPPTPHAPSTPTGDSPNPSASIAHDERLFTGITLTLAALVVGIGLWFQNRPKSKATHLVAPAALATIPPLEQHSLLGLTNLNGLRVEPAHIDSPFLVLNFVFTSCSLQCLAVNHRIAELQNRTASSLQPKFISITIDPRTDSPQALSAFAAKFSADTNRWLFLTGDPAQLESIRARYFPDRPVADSVLNTSAAAFGATEKILVFNRSGACLGIFDGLNPNCASAIESTLLNSNRN